MFKRILLPLDGSKNAEKVIPVAIEFAKLHDASVLLLRVVAPLRQSLMASPGAINQVLGQIDQIVNEYLDEIAEGITVEGIAVETITGRGSPAQWTLDTAKDQTCDLIIIGTHGETGSAQWRFGSVANKIIKAKSEMPLLVIPTLSLD
jgi:nucleotide-binding universal stress UspA family protein